jgi:hypothetical protein
MQDGHALKRAWNKDKDTADAQKCRRGAGFLRLARIFTYVCDNCATAVQRLRKIHSGKILKPGKDFARKCERKNGGAYAPSLPIW